MLLGSIPSSRELRKYHKVGGQYRRIHPGIGALAGSVRRLPSGGKHEHAIPDDIAGISPLCVPRGVQTSDAPYRSFHGKAEREYYEENSGFLIWEAERTGKGMIVDKKGRPREYQLPVDSGYKIEGVAFTLATLDELLERVVDQFNDLEPGEIDKQPEKIYFSIGKLAVHLAKGEATRLSRIGGMDIPSDLSESMKHGDILDGQDLPSELRDSSALVTILRRVREEITKPVCRELNDFDSPLEGLGILDSPRKVLMHMVWHYTYHSGHIGMIRLLLGSDYKWQYAAS